MYLANNCIICRLIDISEIRLKISLETAPSQRPRGVLGIWSPILSAVGNALKIQVTLFQTQVIYGTSCFVTGTKLT